MDNEKRIKREGYACYAALCAKVYPEFKKKDVREFHVLAHPRTLKSIYLGGFATYCDSRDAFAVILMPPGRAGLGFVREVLALPSPLTSPDEFKLVAGPVAESAAEPVEDILGAMGACAEQITKDKPLARFCFEVGIRTFTRLETAGVLEDEWGAEKASVPHVRAVTSSDACFLTPVLCDPEWPSEMLRVSEPPKGWEQSSCSAVRRKD